MNPIKQIKEQLFSEKTPITAEQAKMIAMTGSLCSREERINNFIADINGSVEYKVRTGQYYYLVVLPEDLLFSKAEIETNFKDRGFTISEVTPKNESLFVLSWK